ncbi:MAG TPA: hypothetical protein VJW73_23730 [Gemmatimonadaceae bacterium]|nr:hypothetical protein [Gemmatimonadaceae bacterium]
MRPSRRTSLRPIFLRTAAFLALVAQLAVGVAALGEARAGLGYASHIDPSGTSTHYAHDEAVCAACQARSLHGDVRLQHPPLVVAPRRELAAITAPESRHDSGADTQHLSRAPPALS